MFKRRDNQAQVETLIGKSVSVRGDIEFSGGLHIDGRVTGNVHAVPGVTAALSISEHGVVEGSVSAPNVVLNGRVRGDIRGSGQVFLGARARVQGNVLYGVIEMALGAEISGKLVPQPKPAPPVKASADRSAVSARPVTPPAKVLAPLSAESRS
jgi:cytoskeletal protein CcmA (bactofilin family)